MGVTYRSSWYSGRRLPLCVILKGTKWKDDWYTQELKNFQYTQMNHLKTLLELVLVERDFFQESFRQRLEMSSRSRMLKTLYHYFDIKHWIRLSLFYYIKLLKHTKETAGTTYWNSIRRSRCSCFKSRRC